MTECFPEKTNMADLNYPEDILFGSLGSTVRKKDEKKLHTPEHLMCMLR